MSRDGRNDFDVANKFLQLVAFGSMNLGSKTQLMRRFVFAIVKGHRRQLHEVQLLYFTLCLDAALKLRSAVAAQCCLCPAIATAFPGQGLSGDLSAALQLKSLMGGEELCPRLTGSTEAQ